MVERLPGVSWPMWERFALFELKRFVEIIFDPILQYFVLLQINRSAFRATGLCG